MTTPGDEAPRLLIAGSSHRTGSTLLQRYVTALSSTFVWGENGSFVESLRRASESWPQTARNSREYAEVMDDPSLIERKYTPNLSPPKALAIAAMRDAILQVYRAVPPGFDGWGWKAVAYGHGEIDFLRELFPGLRVLLVVRNPWDVARSVRRKGWIDRRGYYQDMAEVAEHWFLRTRDFLALTEDPDPHLLLLRYEDLHSRLDDIDAFLGISADGVRRGAVLSRRLGAAPAVSRFRLTASDIDAVTRVAGDVAAQLGYAPPGDQASGAAATSSAATG